MIKKLIKTISCIALLFSVLAFTNCKSTGSGSGYSVPSFREPKMFMQALEFSKISFAGVELMARIRVENPNTFEIPFPEVNWEFFIESYSFTSGTIKNNNRLRANSYYNIEIPVTIGYLELLDNFIFLAGRKDFDYKVLVHARIALVEQGGRNWNFERTGNVPILTPPEITFRNIELKNAYLSRMDVQVNLIVENTNNIDLTVNNLSYDLTVNNRQWSRGTIVGSPRLTADRRTIVPVVFTINSLNIIAEFTRSLGGNSEVPYVFSGDFSFGLDLPGLKNLGANFDLRGNTNPGK